MLPILAAFPALAALLGVVTKYLEDGSPISESSVFGEVMGTIIAGADTTTAASIQGARLYLLQSPPALQRLVGELDQTNSVSYADTLPLEYFNAVLKETLRLSPSGIWVPGGFEVGINNWVVGGDKTLYGDDAMEFRPERWLEKGNRARFAEFEFGFGSGNNRVCIGKNFAMMEIRAGTSESDRGGSVG